MTARSDQLQDFLDAAYAAYDQCAEDPASRRSIKQIFQNLETPGKVRASAGKRLPVCDSHLESALAVETGKPVLDRLIAQFKALEPQLEWTCRPAPDESASANFLASHANAMMVGPGGLEDRKDIWLGVTLMAPNVRYPDHDHSPEETYLVLSEADFMHGDSDWFSPGIGGSFYNSPGIKHAMRSGETPLFAFWALLAPPKH